MLSICGYGLIRITSQSETKNASQSGNGISKCGKKIAETGAAIVRIHKSINFRGNALERHESVLNRRADFGVLHKIFWLPDKNSIRKIDLQWSRGSEKEM